MTDPKLKTEFICKVCGRKYAAVIVGTQVFIFDYELMDKVLKAVSEAITNGQIDDLMGSIRRLRKSIDDLTAVLVPIAAEIARDNGRSQPDPPELGTKTEEALIRAKVFTLEPPL